MTTNTEKAYIQSAIPNEEVSQKILDMIEAFDNGSGTGSVTSVNGEQGVVQLDTSDIPEDPSAKYYTEARVDANVDPKIATVQTSVTTEATTRSNADILLQQNINNEISRATTAENAVQSNLNAHINDSTAAHAASAVSNTPSGNLAATNVQSALDELQTELDGVAAIAAEVDALIDLSGVSSGSTNLGSFTETIIPDSSTVKGALQSLETFIASLPDPMEYKGLWDASSNTPTLANGIGDNGDVYQVSVAGTVNFGAGNISFEANDKAVYNGATSLWEKWDQTDAVISINGQTGIVTLNTDNIAEGTTNKYYTETRVNANVDPKILNLQGQIDTEVTNRVNGDNSIQTNLNSHINDTTDAHDASAISYDNTATGLVAVNVQTAVDEFYSNTQTALASKMPLADASTYRVGPGRQYTTIQSALNAIGNSTSAADTQSPKLVSIAGGVYDENLTIPTGRLLTLLAEGTVILGDGLGANWSSTNSRSISADYVAAHVFGSGARPALNIVAVPSSDTTSTFLAQAGCFNISGGITITGSLTRTVNLSSVKINGTFSDTSVGLTNLQAYRTLFVGALTMTNGILERCYDCEFDALVTVLGYNSILNSEIKASMTVTANQNTLPPSGMFFTTFFGTFTGPANSLKLDLTSDYFFRTNGASLGGLATKVLLASNATSSITGLLSSTDWSTFNNKEAAITATTSADYYRGDKTFQPLNKAAVGLPFVDNTSDATKFAGLTTKVLYVSKDTGSDTNTGTIVSPFLTIQKAIDVATAAPSTFNTPIVINVFPGKYTEDLSFTQQGITLQAESPLYHSDSVQLYGGITVNLSGTAGGGNFVAANNNMSINGIEVFASGTKQAIAFSGTTFQRLFLNQCFINQTTTNSAHSALLMTNTGTSGGTKSTITARDTDFANNSSTNATIEVQAGRLFNNGSSLDISNSAATRTAILINGSAAAGPLVYIDHASIVGQASITDNTAILQFSLVSINSGSNPCVALPASPSTGYFVGGDNLFTTTNTNVISGSGIAVLSGANFCGSTGIAIAGTVTQAPLEQLPQGKIRPSGVLVSGLSASLPVKTDASKNLVTAAINLASSTEVTGTLPVNKGGTGNASLTLNNLLVGAGTSANTFIAPGASGTVVKSNGTTFSSAALAASEVTNTPSGNLSSTNVQAALNELQSDIDAIVISPTTKYIKSVALIDWGSPSGGEYTLTIPFSTHGIPNPLASCYETNGATFDFLMCPVNIDASYNITIKINQTPDTRFIGKIVIE